MKRTVSVLDIIEVVVVAVTVLTGWAISFWQLGREGWIAGGGTAWLFTFSDVCCPTSRLAHPDRCWAYCRCHKSDILFD
jgi:hypothetical protein